MRYRDILREDANIKAAIKDSILDLIIPLKSQGISQFSLSQLIDNVVSNPDIMGFDISPNYIISIVKRIPGCSVHTDANGDQVVDLGKFNQTSVARPKVSDVEKNAIKQAKRELE